MTRAEQYAICQERGHAPLIGALMTSDEPWSICKYCGTQYQYEKQLVERNSPWSSA